MPPPEGHGLSRESGRLRPGGSAARQAGRIVRTPQPIAESGSGCGGMAQPIMSICARRTRACPGSITRPGSRRSGLETGRHPLLRLWSREPQRGPRISGNLKRLAIVAGKEGLRCRHRRGQDRVLRRLTLLFDRRIGLSPTFLLRSRRPPRRRPRLALDEELAQSDQKEQRPEAEKCTCTGRPGPPYRGRPRRRARSWPRSRPGRSP